MRSIIAAVHESLVGTNRTWCDVRSESAFGVKRKSGLRAVRSVVDPQRTSIQSDLIAQSVCSNGRCDEMVAALDLRSKLGTCVHQPHKSERRVRPGNKFAIPFEGFGLGA